jgi:DNA modification methylase
MGNTGDAECLPEDERRHQQGYQEKQGEAEIRDIRISGKQQSETTAKAMIETDRIYHMDCLEGMSLMADGSVDAIITDLPYGVLNRKNKAAEWDRRIPFAPLWEQYRRITKPDSPIILFAQGMFTAELIRSQPDLWKYNLVWMKDRVSGHLNANRMPLRQHEDIVVFYKKLPVYHPQMSYKPGQKNHPRGMFKRTTNHCYGAMKPTRSHISDWKYPTSIVCIPREFKTGCFYHPTQKPVKLIEYLIKTYTDEGDTVLDNCIGSGTTAVAAIRTGRHYIGFEIDRTYCEIAERRIREEIKNGNQTK